MKTQQKIQKLLAANKAQYHTFSDRAKNARLILIADSFGLDCIAESLNVKF